MPCYVVCYDLNTVGQNYECITRRIKELTHFHAQQSVWFVQHSGPETALVEYLKGCLDSNDRLFVSEVSKSWAGINMPKGETWLNSRGY